jgi:hypothetical protein
VAQTENDLDNIFPINIISGYYTAIFGVKKSISKTVNTDIVQALSH